MSLAVRARIERPGFSLDVALEIAEGQTVALVGPNAAGKSTLLEAIAGLVALDSGRVALDRRVLSKAGESGRVDVDVSRRCIGLLGQDPVLFTHLSVRDNVGFGLRARGVPRRRARSIAETWLADVGLGGLGARRPSGLSGGQQQRVAIARALATEPRLLLLDEPTAALDADAAPHTRKLLRAVLARSRATTLLVTHSPADALALADRVVVLEQGRVVADGPTATLLSHPPTAFAASLVGTNYLPVVTSGAASLRASNGATFRLGASGHARRAAAVTFSPRHVTVTRSGPSTGGTDALGAPTRTAVWSARIASLEYDLGGAVVRFDDDPVVAVVAPEAVTEQRLRTGDAVTLSVPHGAVSAVER